MIREELDSLAELYYRFFNYFRIISIEQYEIK